MGEYKLSISYNPYMKKIVVQVAHRNMVIYEKPLYDKEVLQLYDAIKDYLEDGMSDSTGLFKLLIKAVRELIRLKAKGEI